MATEFGDTSSACSSTYYSELIAYMNQAVASNSALASAGVTTNPANAMSWSGYGWFVAGCTFPSLISSWTAYTPVSGGGSVVQAALMAY
jgi:hypothetical protein